jgi:integrase
VSVLAYAGLRPGEALVLTWADVGERTILIERSVALGEVKEAKTRTTRSVRLLAPLSKELKRYGCNAAARATWCDLRTRASAPKQTNA